jgi:phosphatidylglycerophosphatase A
MTDTPTNPDRLAGLAAPKDEPHVALGFALVTTFGLGHMRPASGTWGSLPPVALALGLAAFCQLTGSGWWVYAAPLIAILLASCAACVFMGDRAEARFGKKDASQIVADETAGQCLPLLAVLPATLATDLTAEGLGGFVPAAIAILLAFFAFRGFDIWKPQPADALQRVPGGWGVLLDDLVAGVYAAIPVALLQFFI